MANTYKFQLTAQQISDLLMRLYMGEGTISVVNSVPSGEGVVDHLYVYYNSVAGTTSLYIYDGTNWHQISSGGGGEPANYLVSATYVNNVLTIVPNEGQPIVINIPTGGGDDEYEYTGQHYIDIDDFVAASDNYHCYLTTNSETATLFTELIAASGFVVGKMFKLLGIDYASGLSTDTSPKVNAIKTAANVVYIEYFTLNGEHYVIKLDGQDTQQQDWYIVERVGYAI